MAKFDLKFIDAWDDNQTIEVKHIFDEDTEIGNPNYLEITTYYLDIEDRHSIILDISTAIKFAKTLRTEINKAKEGGQNNG
jgi:mRNA deadenylase 3'-5' endonuclease subunit Ccr4